MPKLPRDVWVQSGGTRHQILRKDLLVVAIPRHGPIKTGTLAAILRRCKVQPDEWSGF